MPFKDPLVKSKAVEALLSGKYKQIKGKLAQVDENTGENVAFCGLGVMCEATGEPVHCALNIPNELTLDSWGLTFEEAKQIFTMNDVEGKSLKEIGCWVEKNL